MISRAIEKGSGQDSEKAGERLALPRSTVIAAVFLAFHLLLVFWRPNPFWGADLLFYYRAPLWILFTLLAVLILLPGFRRQVRTWVCSIPITIWGNGYSTWLTRAVMLLVALAVFTAFRTASHLLGDGYLLLRELERNIWRHSDWAPLTFALIRNLHKLGSPLWETAENTYRIYSYASGLLFFLLCFPVAGAIGKCPREKSIVLAFLLTGGYLQLFFGYVENYSLYVPGILLYLLVGLRASEGRMPIFFPALLLGILIAFHLVFVFFGPSLLVLVYCSNRRKETGWRYKNVLVTLTAVFSTLLSAGIFLWIAGVDFAAYLAGMGGRHHLPVFAEPGFGAPYHLWSLTHLLDFLNLLLLSAPAALMAFFVLGKGTFRGQPFLAAAAAFPLVFAFVANPEIGAFRDWDVLALPAIPLTLWSADVLLERIRDPEKQFHTAFPICAAAALHCLLWIVLNAHEAAAEARYVHQMDKLTGYARSYGWETLGAYHNLQNKPVPALKAYKRALEANPDNPRHWTSVGIAYRYMDQPVVAIPYLQKAIQLNPENALAYLNLGLVYGKVDDLKKTTENLEKAIAIDPDNANAHLNIGIAFGKMERLSAAIEHLEKAAELQPDLGEAYVNLGAAYSKMGDSEKAIQHLQKAAEQLPDNATVFSNLGAVNADLGEYASSIKFLERAVELKPDYLAAYLNLSSTYKAMGQPDKAVEYLKKAAAFHPGDPTVHLNLGATYRSLGKHENAILSLQKAIQINPSLTTAYFNLGLAYHSLNRMKEAKASMQKVLELNPDDPLAPEIKQFLEESPGL